MLNAYDITSNLTSPLYKTEYGSAYVGDSLNLLPLMPESSIDLVITSPPFALLRQKEYGNEAQEAYVDWFMDFARDVYPVLKDTGSFVVDLGGAYQKGRPVRSLYNYRILLRLCDELNFRLAEEFFWFNPSKLPSPIEWVNKRKVRAKDAVNTVWWFSKSDWPKADVKNVLMPYSERMKKLLKNQDDFYTPKERPSGHDISKRFGDDNGGAIPPNLLEMPNSESNSAYLSFCKYVNVKPHPARFPKKLPRFFIEFLTDPGDIVLDIFAGSNTTGEAAEETDRRWIAFDSEREYVAASVFRFLTDTSKEKAAQMYHNLGQTSDVITLETSTPKLGLF